MTKTTRFIAHDTLAATATRLVTAAQKRTRYWVIDTEHEAQGTEYVYDEFASKRAATGTARDLNQGLYGPLAAS